MTRDQRFARLENEAVAHDTFEHRGQTYHVIWQGGNEWNPITDDEGKAKTWFMEHNGELAEMIMAGAEDNSPLFKAWERARKACLRQT